MAAIRDPGCGKDAMREERKKQAVQLPVAYCSSCHLATRTDRDRCIHCGRMRRAPCPGPACRTGEARTDLTIPPSKATNVLLVSPFAEDHFRMRQILGGTGSRLWRACSLLGTRRLLHGQTVPIIVCERELPDGTWKDLLEFVKFRVRPPLLIVTSRLADERLWAEVLNLGGFDVLARPFEEREVRWALQSARQAWQSIAPARLKTA